MVPSARRIKIVALEPVNNGTDIQQLLYVLMNLKKLIVVFRPETVFF